MGNDVVAFKSWLDAYGHAWENRDPEAATALFSEDGTYRSHSFSNPCVDEKPFSSIGLRWPGPKRTSDSHTKS